MDWRELMKLIPLVAGSVDPRAGAIAVAIEALAADEIAKHQSADPTKTRDQIITEAAAQWDVGLDKVALLKKMGHEGDQ